MQYVVYYHPCDVVVIKEVEMYRFVDGYTNIISKHDIMEHNIVLEEKKMASKYFNVNWNEYSGKLSKLAIDENWSNDTYPNNGILVNYMAKTYERLKNEGNVVLSEEYGLFNTGLFTKYFEPIYAYQPHNGQVTFMTEYELSGIGIMEYPERANYFKDPELLLFDWHYPVIVQYEHILESEGNINRLPKDIKENDNLAVLLDGAVNMMKRRISANYKLAIPQFFDNKIQLLLPLCLLSAEKPDLALVVTKVGNVYRGHTCITLDMAYNNARLIARPENNWLTN